MEPPRIFCTHLEAPSGPYSEKSVGKDRTLRAKNRSNKSADPALAGYRRVRYCLPSMSSLHVFLPLPLLCCLPSISSLHVFLPLSLLSSGDLGRVREGGWAAEKRWGTPSPPTPPPPPPPSQASARASPGPVGKTRKNEPLKSGFCVYFGGGGGGREGVPLGRSI